MSYTKTSREKGVSLADELNQSQTEATKNILASPHQRLRLIGWGLLGISLLVVGLVAWFRYGLTDAPRLADAKEQETNQLVVTTAATEEAKTASKLDGTLVTPDLATRRPLAIMVENHPEARPQFGLEQASVVYEAIAEGGITRFLALFGPQDTVKVGPVRSARTYFIDWALEYAAAYAHVGGNIDALDLIKQAGVYDLDQFALGEKAFRREPQGGVAFEHTMYTDTGKLRTIDDATFTSEQDWTEPTFKADIAREHRTASQVVSVNFSSPEFAVRWIYDPETNTYLRQMAGQPHKDGASGNTLRANNIFVQIVERSPIVTRINEKGYKMTTVGSGPATVFQDGKKIEATWKKASRTAPTIFTDPTGAVITRNPGVTWFEIIPPEGSVTNE